MNIIVSDSISSYNQPPGDLGESEHGQSLWRKRFFSTSWFGLKPWLLPSKPDSFSLQLVWYHGPHGDPISWISLSAPATRSFKSSSHNSGRHVPSSQTLKRMTCRLRKRLGSGSAKLCLNHHESPPHNRQEFRSSNTHTHIKIGGEWWQRTLNSGLSKSLLFGGLLCEGCTSACWRALSFGSANRSCCS